MLKKLLSGCIFRELWQVFFFCAAWGAQKCKQPKYIWPIQEKTNLTNPRNCLYRFKHAYFVLILKFTDPSRTVRLLTHVLCKPTHFFFHSFIAIMHYCLQTSFNSVMKDWADKYHVWGTPMRSPSRSNSR